MKKLLALNVGHSAAKDNQYDQHQFHKFIIVVAGPRNCIGMRFALLEAKVALLAVCRRFVVVGEAIVVFTKLCLQIYLPTWDKDERALEAGSE